ncbi:MAG: flagellar hook-length control protein FliK, partial [Pseudomonadota bacterium]
MKMIGDSVLLTAPTAVKPYVMDQTVENHQQGTGGFPDDFPSLLKVEWPPSEETKLPVDAKEADVDTDINAAEIESAIEQDMDTALGLAEMLHADDTRLQSSPEEAIAKYLLFNNYFSISIQPVSQGDVPDAEIGRLISNFNTAVARGGEHVQPSELQVRTTPDLKAGINGSQDGIRSPKTESVEVQAQLHPKQENALRNLVADQIPKPVADVATLPASAAPKTGKLNELASSPVQGGGREIQYQSAQPAGVNFSVKSVAVDHVSSQARLSPVHTLHNQELSNEGRSDVLTLVSTADLPKKISKVISEVISKTGQSNVETVNDKGVRQTNTLQKLEIQLIPRTLGVIQISIEKTGNGVNITLSAETSEAERILLSEKSSVVEALRGVGKLVEDFKIVSLPTVNPGLDDHTEKNLDRQNDAWKENDFAEASSDDERDQRPD